MRDERIDVLLRAAERMGGHGGLISHETMRAADEVRRAASAFRANDAQERRP